jgi:cytochrome c-type biogenesis protein CcmH
VIWVLVTLLAALTLAPLAWAVTRGARVRGRRDAAILLHKAQLAELDRDLAAGRLLPEEHAAAQLEVQRRLLADAALSEAEPPPPGRLALLLTVVAVPTAALGLYLSGGHPDYRADERLAAAATAAGAQTAAADQQAATLIAQLRARLAIMDPMSDRAREGFITLGRAEWSLGRLPEAADAFQHALASKFDPSLAAATAELMTESEGHMSAEAAALFRRALAAAPPNAPWRATVEARLAKPGAPLAPSQ